MSSGGLGIGLLALVDAFLFAGASGELCGLFTKAKLSFGVSKPFGVREIGVCVGAV